MNGVLKRVFVKADDGRAGLVSADAGGRRAGLADRAPCFHCGEPCHDFTFAQGEKTFCCQGCLVVHDLLAETGLAHFYDLNRHPGVRVGRPAALETWAYLDDPVLQQRLLDFTDGKISRVTFSIPTIHCVACVWLLENLFRLRPGIGRSQVHFTRREVTIDFAADDLKLSELVSLLASLGYEPALTLGALEKGKPRPLARRQWLQIGVAGFAFGNIMLFSIPTYFGLDSLNGPILQRLFGYLSLALALPVLIYSASDYWKSARFSLRQRRLTLDVPIALGLAALYARSAYEVVAGRGVGYLDSLVGLVFFLLCGRAFQQRTQDRLVFDRDYKSFFPLSVTRQTDAGQESIALSNLRTGDRIRLRNGELIPADAKLVRGPALIDYSFVTGESEPVAKVEGDHLYAGGKQIGGAIEVETVKPVSQSYLTSLWNHEAFRKNRVDDSNTLTNRFSRRFTPAVIGVAIGAAVFWLAAGDPGRAAKAFISVLIVACPCALALAAPFTFGTAQRWLARPGVFLRNALVLERLAQVNTIVFDKTGTLTAPRGAGISFQGEPLSATEAGQVDSLASHSTHPHSANIHELLAGSCPPEPVQQFQETPGCGIEGRIAGREILLGSRAWLSSRGIGPGPGPVEIRSRDHPTNPQEDGASVPAPAPPTRCDGASARRERLRRREGASRLFSEKNRLLGSLAPSDSTHEPDSKPGILPDAGPDEGSVVHLAIDRRYRGAFRLSGALRPETDRLLRDLGCRYEIALLSGDNEKEREHFGRFFGGDARLNFNQSPVDKLGYIRGLQNSGRIVMMVGDGLNDAGALKQSDVGVAVVEEAAAFSPASDVILEGNQVARLPEILKFARASVRIVRLSFGISGLYNLVGVSIAAAGILSPLICALLMPLSSLSVVLFACGAVSRAARRAGLGQASTPPRRREAVPLELQPAFQP